MGIVLGFGSTEKGFEEAEISDFRAFCEAEYHRQNCEYVTDELAAACEKWLDARAADYRRDADKFRKAEDYPGRYSYFWPTVLHDASHIVAIFRFSHINRRHALSSDGWAMMQTEVPVIALRSVEVQTKARAEDGGTS